MRFVILYIGLDRIPFIVRDIRRIAHNHVKAPRAVRRRVRIKRFEQIPSEEIDAIGDAMPDGVFSCDVQSVFADVRCDSASEFEILQERNRKTPRSRADVSDQHAVTVAIARSVSRALLL